MSEHLYRFFDAQGRLLYVGVTNSPPARFKQHGRDKEWWDQVASIKLESHPSREDVLAAEREAIRVESPYYNTVHDVQSATDLLSFKFGATPAIYSRLLLSIEESRVTKGRLDEIEKVLDAYPGPAPVYVRLFVGSGAWAMYVTSRRVRVHHGLMRDLRTLLGDEGVTFE